MSKVEPEAHEYFMRTHHQEHDVRRPITKHTAPNRRLLRSSEQAPDGETSVPSF